MFGCSDPCHTKPGDMFLAESPGVPQKQPAARAHHACLAVYAAEGRAHMPRAHTVQEWGCKDCQARRHPARPDVGLAAASSSDAALNKTSPGAQRRSPLPSFRMAFPRSPRHSLHPPPASPPMKLNKPRVSFLVKLASPPFVLVGDAQDQRRRKPPALIPKAFKPQKNVRRLVLLRKRLSGPMRRVIVAHETLLKQSFEPSEEADGPDIFRRGKGMALCGSRAACAARNPCAVQECWMQRTHGASPSTVPKKFWEPFPCDNPCRNKNRGHGRHPGAARGTCKNHAMEMALPHAGTKTGAAPV